jgi:hypothetical protein
VFLSLFYEFILFIPVSSIKAAQTEFFENQYGNDSTFGKEVAGPLNTCFFYKTP